MAEGGCQDDIQVPPLVTHLVSIDEAPDMYSMLRDEPGRQLGVIFDCTN